MLVLTPSEQRPFLFSQKSKRAPAQGGKKNEKRYVYVKIEDNAGNKHYISTDGIVVYSDAAQVTTEITYTTRYI